MQITSDVDIEAPLAAVMATLSDFDRWEQAMERRGAAVNRTRSPIPTGPGAAWTMRLDYRGKDRDIALRLVTMDADTLAFSGSGDAIVGDIVFGLTATAPQRTRLALRVDLRASTFGGRLLLQTLNLGRGAIETKLNHRLLALALNIETRHTADHPQRPWRARSDG